MEHSERCDQNVTEKLRVCPSGFCTAVFLEGERGLDRRCFQRWRGSAAAVGLGSRPASAPAPLASATSPVTWGLCQERPFLNFSTKVCLVTKDSKYLSLGDFRFNIYCFFFF